MGDVVVDKRAATAGTGEISNASTEADQSATYIDFRAAAQTTAKWGEEHGPSTFMSLYTKELDDTKTTVMKLAAGLEQFAKTMNAIIKGLDSTDQAAAASFRTAITDATRKAPSAPEGVIKAEMEALVTLVTGVPTGGVTPPSDVFLKHH